MGFPESNSVLPQKAIPPIHCVRDHLIAMVRVVGLVCLMRREQFLCYVLVSEFKGRERTAYVGFR